MSKTMSTWDALKEACATASDANQRIGELERSLSLARAVIEALPACRYRTAPATHEGFERHGVSCDEHVSELDGDAVVLPYRAALLAWKEGQR